MLVRVSKKAPSLVAFGWGAYGSCSFSENMFPTLTPHSLTAEQAARWIRELHFGGRYEIDERPDNWSGRLNSKTTGT